MSGNGRTAWGSRVDKFEQMMEVANEAQGQAMMWMARVMEKRAEEAEHRTEGAKEETAAFECAMMNGQEVMETALALLGEVGLGGWTNGTTEKVGIGKIVGSDETAVQNRRQGGKHGDSRNQNECTTDGAVNRAAWEVQKGDELIGVLE